MDGIEGLLANMDEEKGEVDPKADDNLKSEWNKYLDFLDTKKVRGNPSLDTNQEGFKYLDEYIKANPGTILSRESILPIQKALLEYRNKGIENIQSGKATYDKPIETFMEGLSKLDGYPGQFTTRYKFPAAILTSNDNGKITRDTIPFAPSDLSKLKKAL